MVAEREANAGVAIYFDTLLAIRDLLWCLNSWEACCI
jgi:hypothetical protein